MKFGDPLIRDSCLDIIEKLNLSMSNHRIWMPEDLPLPIRSEKKFLFGLKRLMVSWTWEKTEIIIDMEHSSFSFGNQRGIEARAHDQIISFDYTHDWKDRL